MGKKTPKAPDPQATANAQSQANREAVIESARVNAVDQHGPWGSTTFQRNADGTPSSQTVSLSGQGQRIFDGQMSLAEQMGNRANQAVGQLPQGPLDTSSLPGRVSSIAGGPIVTGMNPQASELQRTIASRSGDIQGSIASRSGDIQSSVASRSGDIQGSIASRSGDIQGSVASRSGDIQGSVASRAGEFQRAIDPGTTGMATNVASRSGQLQRGIGSRTSEVANLQPQNFDAATQRAQDASFQKAQSLFAPQQQLDQQRLEQSLSDRGIPLDSPAGRAEMDRMQRAQSEQTNRAAFDAIAAGSGEHSRLFGLDATTTQINNAAAGQRFSQDLGAGQFRNQATNDAFAQDVTSGRFANEAAGQAFGQRLATANFANNATDRAFAQDVASGQFRNQAAGQAFAQDLGAGQFRNQAIEQAFGQDLSAGQFRNQAVGQAFGQDLSAGNFQNAAIGQAFGQDVGAGQFRNQAIEQAFGQDLSAGQFRNQAVGQAFGQDLSAGNFQNAATGQSFGQHLSANNFLNGAQNQGFNQALQAANFQNGARSSALQEQIALRNQQMNEAGFFMGGPAMQTPQFQQTPTYGQQAPDVAGMINNQYNAQVQQTAAQNQGLFGLGSAVAGSSWFGPAVKGLFAMSDRRLKTDVQRIGTGWRGLPLYLFRYVWGGPAHVGVMAQDALKVAPEAVHRVGGFLAVDYGALRGA